MKRESHEIWNGIPNDKGNDPQKKDADSSCEVLHKDLKKFTLADTAKLIFVAPVLAKIFVFTGTHITQPVIPPSKMMISLLSEPGVITVESKTFTPKEQQESDMKKCRDLPEVHFTNTNDEDRREVVFRNCKIDKHDNRSKEKEDEDQ